MFIPGNLLSSGPHTHFETRQAPKGSRTFQDFTKGPKRLWGPSAAVWSVQGWSGTLGRFLGRLADVYAVRGRLGRPGAVWEARRPFEASEGRLRPCGVFRRRLVRPKVVYFSTPPILALSSSRKKQTTLSNKENNNGR